MEQMEIKECNTVAKAQEHINQELFQELYNRLDEWEIFQNRCIDENILLYSEDGKTPVIDLLEIEILNNYILLCGIVEITFQHPYEQSKTQNMRRLNVILSCKHNNQSIYKTGRPKKNGTGLAIQIQSDCYNKFIPSNLYPTIITYYSLTKNEDFNNWRNKFTNYHLYNLTMLIFDYLYYMSIIFNSTTNIIPKNIKLIKHKKWVIDNIININNINSEYIYYLTSEEMNNIFDYGIPCFDLTYPINIQNIQIQHDQIDYAQPPLPTPDIIVEEQQPEQIQLQDHNNEEMEIDSDFLNNFEF